jgi:hypothetical protein
MENEWYAKNDWPWLKNESEWILLKSDCGMITKEWLIPNEEQTRMAGQRLSRMSDLPRMTDMTKEQTRITECKTDQETVND